MKKKVVKKATKATTGESNRVPPKKPQETTAEAETPPNAFSGLSRPMTVPPIGEEIKMMSALMNQLLQMQMQLLQATQNIQPRQPQPQLMNLQLQNPLYQMNLPQAATQLYQVPL